MSFIAEEIVIKKLRKGHTGCVDSTWCHRDFRRNVSSVLSIQLLELERPLPSRQAESCTIVRSCVQASARALKLPGGYKNFIVLGYYNRI